MWNKLAIHIEYKSLCRMVKRSEHILSSFLSSVLHGLRKLDVI